METNLKARDPKARDIRPRRLTTSESRGLVAENLKSGAVSRDWSDSQARSDTVTVQLETCFIFAGPGPGRGRVTVY